MVGVQFDAFARFTAATASIVISEENILPYIVVTQHFSLLVVFSLRDRIPLLYSFNKLQIEFCRFHDNPGDRKDDAYSLYGSNMLLDLYLYRRGKPTFTLTVGTVIKSGLTITCRAVSSGSAELSSSREQVYHIIARFYFRSV